MYLKFDCFFLYSAFEGVEVVFHTAAADPSKNNLQLHYKVNVEGQSKNYSKITLTLIK